VKDEISSQEEPRCQILRHAVELFSHYGYSKTNIGDIAKACNMSPGNLYRHFRNKQAIGEEAVREYLANEEAQMALIVADQSLSFEARFRKFFHHSVNSIVTELRSNPKMVELAAMVTQGNSGIFAQHVTWKQQQVTTILSAGIETGEIAGDPAKISFVLYDITKSFVTPSALIQMDYDTIPVRLDAVLDLALKGMRADTVNG